MCKPWLCSHWDPNTSAILNLSEFWNFVLILLFLVKIIMSFCRVYGFVFVGLLSLSQRQNCGCRRGKRCYCGEFPSTPLHDRFECVNCFVVSGNMFWHNNFSFICCYPLRKTASPVRAKVFVPWNRKQMQIMAVLARCGTKCTCCWNKVKFLIYAPCCNIVWD